MIPSLERRIKDINNLTSLVKEKEKELDMCRSNNTYNKCKSEIFDLYVKLDFKLDMLKISVGAVISTHYI